MKKRLLILDPGERLTGFLTFLVRGLNIEEEQLTHRATVNACNDALADDLPSHQNVFVYVPDRANDRPLRPKMEALLISLREQLPKKKKVTVLVPYSRSKCELNLDRLLGADRYIVVEDFYSIAQLQPVFAALRNALGD